MTLSQHGWLYIGLPKSVRRTFKCSNQGFGIEGRLRIARSSVRGYGALSETVDKVTHYKVFIGEVVEGKVRSSWEETRLTGTSAIHVVDAVENRGATCGEGSSTVDTCGMEGCT